MDADRKILHDFNALCAASDLKADSGLGSDFSPEEFRSRISENRDLIAAAIADGSETASDKQTALVNILRYLDLQLSRAAWSIDKEADLMAGVLRSLIELRCWVNFISESSENATQFLREKSIDDRELFDHLREVFPSNAELLAMPLTPGKRRRVEPNGPYEVLIWRLCSKLMHPSSDVINDLEGSVYDFSLRQLLARHVVDYSGDILISFYETCE